MSWVNLNDVYVNQTGGTIAGDLSVNGALTVNDGKGTNTTYNVANEITTLRDSVSLTEDTCKGANGWVVRTGAITRTENCVTMWVDVVAGTGANKNVNVTFATMPPAFAPKTYDIELPVLGFTTTSYPISFWIRITTSGEIKIKQYVLPANTVLGQIKCCCTYLKI